MIHKYWRWQVGNMQGKAATEPEAWRLAKDAKRFLRSKVGALR